MKKDNKRDESDYFFLAASSTTTIPLSWQQTIGRGSSDSRRIKIRPADFTKTRLILGASQ